MENYQIDNLDRGILEALMANARTAYAELAKQFGVSPGTIHVRVEKMKQAGIITGARIDVSPKQLGYDVCCFIGIILKSAKDYPSALEKLNALDEVTEAYYTTGHYSIFIKVMCRSIDALQQVLINKIQTIDEIQSTETLISAKPDHAYYPPVIGQFHSTFSTGRSQLVHSVQWPPLYLSERSMADITLISGSTTGGAEYVAEHLAEKLEDAGFSTQTLHGPLLEDLPTDGVWLLITSTHGAGDLPDNLQPLYDELLEQQPDLANVRFGAVGIGSREYDTFCGAIEKVEAAVTACGAKQLGETLKINILDHDIPEDPAEIWLAEWKNLLKND